MCWGRVACGGDRPGCDVPVISTLPHWHYKRAGLGYLVQEPLRLPWVPPPTLDPRQDPHLLARVIRGLRRL